MRVGVQRGERSPLRERDGVQRYMRRHAAAIHSLTFVAQMKADATATNGESAAR